MTHSLFDPEAEAERELSGRDPETPANDDGPRPLYVIAADIRRTWPKIWFGAVPYVEALEQLDKVTDNYGYDSSESIVNYFLSNAGTWRGEDARRIKAELKALVGR